MSDATFAKQWKRQGGVLALFLLLLIFLYYPSYASMVSVWIRSETFAHGFIILPICGWLIWRIREQIAATQPQVNYLGIPMLLLLGFVWLLANYVGVLVAEQLAVTLMIPVLVFTLLGWQACSVMVFPLMFILFAVPIGEELTPVLIDFTADFTVALIGMAGIPVYREGTFFQLPTGNWSVVAACSGVRYLIASVTLGVLYAYLNYQGLLKRALFVLAACLVPIIANGLRAFMIVMIGHFSGMELATGVDHLVYGWFFFGIVIFIMFYIGSFWRDDENRQLNVIGWTLGNLKSPSLVYKLALASVVLVLVLWPLKIQLEQQPFDFNQVSEIAVVTPEGWREVMPAVNSWKPAYHGFDREFLSAYEDPEGYKVTLFIGYYAQQRQDAELGNYNNVLVTEDDEAWRSVPRAALKLPEAGIEAPAAIIKNSSDQFLTTYFFYVDGQWATNKYQTKWLQLKARLFGGSDYGAIVVITSQLKDADVAATEVVGAFSSDALATIKRSLDGMQ